MNTERGLVPKICGGDYELANFIVGEPTGSGDPRLASQLLLAEVQGVSALHSSLRVRGRAGAGEAGPEQGDYFHHNDWGRLFIPENASCVYIDLDHIELAIPEVRGALDHLAAMRAMFSITREAMDRVNDMLPEGQRLRVLLNNSDGNGNSYGTHLNFMLATHAFRQITMLRGEALLFLASFHASIMLLGQGKVGSEDGAPPVNYQWSQRADFCRHQLLAENTMHPDRPLVNTRNEPHAAWETGLSRLHVICHDNNLCPVACVIKVGLLSIILCMIEAGEMPEELLLADPPSASVRFSHDTGFSARVARMDGREATSLDILEGFVEAAQKFAADGRLEGIVPDWELILQLSAQTVGLLRARDYPALARRLDGFLKLALLKEAMRTHGLGWRSPGTKMLDHLYSSLDDDGLYWACARDGMVEQLVSDDAIEHFRHHPPADTRAAIRAKMLQLIPADAIRRVDWSSIFYELTDANDRRRFYTINMPDPAKGLDPASPLGRATTFQDFIGLMHPPPFKPGDAALSVTPAA